MARDEDASGGGRNAGKPPSGAAEQRDPRSFVRGPKTPLITPPLDARFREAWLDAPDAVTALRELDGTHEFEVPSKGTFRIGASRQCELSRPGSGMSSVHCVCEPRAGGLRVVDGGSKNGTYFGDRKLSVFDVRPGDVFAPAPCTYLALNEPMRHHRATFVEVLGLRSPGSPGSPDRALIEATKGAGHMLIAGPSGCDHARLAYAIHAVSLRRQREIVQLSAAPDTREGQRALLDEVARSTLLLALDMGPRDSRSSAFDPEFVHRMMSPDSRIRVIVTAVNGQAARRVLGEEAVATMTVLQLAPLSFRTGDLPWLFDRLVVERGGAFRFSDLQDSNQVALTTWHWPDNLEELRQAVDRFVAIVNLPDWEDLDWRSRSAALGLPKSTIYDWYRKVALADPLIPRATR